MTMRARTMLLAGLLLTSAAAQSRPDFSGEWTHDAARSRDATTAARAGGGAGGGSFAFSGQSGSPTVLTITQTAATITIARVRGDSRTTTVYTLDGSESVNTIGNVTTRMKSRWEGAALVSEGTQVANVDGQARTLGLREIRTLEADGTLKVETIRQMPDGPSASAAIFTKNK